jgi:aminopeptidase N
MKKIYLTLPLIFILYSLNSQHLNNGKFRSNLDIIHYDIHLTITDFITQEIHGYTVLKLNPRIEDLKEIILEFEGLEVDSIYFFKEKISNYTYNGKTISLPCQKELPNDKCGTEIKIYYHGHPKQDEAWGGFFFTDSSAYNIGVGMEADPNSFGRVWFPCIDSFEEKATFDFYITVKNEHKAICSGKLINKTQNEDGTVTWHWSMSKEVPPYLVSVAVAEYDVIKDIYKGIKRDIPVSLYMFPEDIANAKVSFRNLPGAMKTYETHYGEYVWDRVGYVEVPFMNGAMEHVCNIAYPEYAVDSTTFRETLMAHELSHHWFGNLVTCKTSKDMWLNEGWAVFSEALFKEHVYGKEAYKEYSRENHAKVLTMAHIYDNGYRAVYGIPHEYTYGTTVYDKGADVARTLRGYMQDTVFFPAIQAYLDAFSYKAASTYDFRDYLSEYSGIDLNDFFDTWVFEKGFPHFCINRFQVEKVQDAFEVNFSIEQNLSHRDFYGINNLIDLTFVDEDFNMIHERVNMSGPTENYSFSFPNKILNVFVDLEEKICDASLDNYTLFESMGSHSFPFTDFAIDVKKLKGKLFIQSSMNHITIPDSDLEGYNISKLKYWEIRAASKEKFTAEGTFFVSMLENELKEDFEDLVLLYRAHPQSEFEEVETELIKHTDEQGLVIIKDLQFGQYVVAVRE